MIVPIDSIDTMGRLPREDVDLETLAKSILDQGLRFPVLVRDDFVLIDGLSRLEASRLAGFSAIEVIVAHTSDQAIKALAASHADGPDKRIHYPPWRINQIWNVLLSLPRQNVTRGNGHPGRTALMKALKLSSENVVQAAVFVYKMAAEDQSEEGEVARQAIQEIEAGRLSSYGARIRIYKYRNDQKRLLDGEITPAQIKRTISSVIEQFVGLTRVLEKIPRSGIGGGFTPEEAHQLHIKMYRFQRSITPITMELLKRFKSEEDASE